MDVNGTIVQDMLQFEPSGSFVQNVTVMSSQACLQNWIFWDGKYQYDGLLSLEMAFQRCKQGGFGCLQCGATAIETAFIHFGADCSTVYLDLPLWTAPRTYFAIVQ